MVLGPFLAIISFVCSVGNVPLAAALWGGGIGFGCVVAFVFADLITLPLLAIYRKYYGTALTLRILATFWVTMTVASLAVEYLFRAVGIHDPTRHKEAVAAHLEWNYTTILNILALIAFAIVYGLYWRRGHDSATFGKDPVCGMQVEIAHAPATRTKQGKAVYFCSDHCAHRFDADPARFTNRSSDTTSDATPHEHHGERGAATAVDPVCRMSVDPATTPHHGWHDGTDYYFCAAGCRDRFLAHPERYLALTVSPATGRGPFAITTQPAPPPAGEPGEGCGCGGHDGHH